MCTQVLGASGEFHVMTKHSCASTALINTPYSSSPRTLIFQATMPIVAKSWDGHDNDNPSAPRQAPTCACQTPSLPASVVLCPCVERTKPSASREMAVHFSTICAVTPGRPRNLYHASTCTCVAAKSWRPSMYSGAGGTDLPATLCNQVHTALARQVLYVPSAVARSAPSPRTRTACGQVLAYIYSSIDRSLVRLDLTAASSYPFLPAGSPRRRLLAMRHWKFLLPCLVAVTLAADENEASSTPAPAMQGADLPSTSHNYDLDLRGTQYGRVSLQAAGITEWNEITSGFSFGRRLSRANLPMGPNGRMAFTNTLIVGLYQHGIRQVIIDDPAAVDDEIVAAFKLNGIKVVLVNPEGLDWRGLHGTLFMAFREHSYGTLILESGRFPGWVATVVQTQSMRASDMLPPLTFQYFWRNGVNTVAMADNLLEFARFMVSDEYTVPGDPPSRSLSQAEEEWEDEDWCEVVRPSRPGAPTTEAPTAPPSPGRGCLPLGCLAVVSWIRHRGNPPHDKRSEPATLPPTAEQNRTCEREMNWATRPRRTCDRLEQVKVGIKLAPGFLEGTWDCLGLSLPGLAGPYPQAIAWKPDSGTDNWATLDLDRWLGPRTASISIDKITRVNLTVENCGNYIGIHNDAFKVEEAYIQAKCVDSGRNASLVYSSIAGEYHHSRHGPILEMGPAETFTYLQVRPEWWVITPRCQTVRMVEVEFQLGSNMLHTDGGTWDVIALSLGTLKTVPLVARPKAGSVITDNLDLVTLFGSLEVDIRDITSINLMSIPGDGDQWRFHGITLNARCADGSGKIQLTKYSHVDEWVKYNATEQFVWSGNVTVGDWEDMA
ncbi:hypothetical protein DCS_03086 [Drechmeria coniospora]|uniref:Uncharacterized protein n=1 Tax=Drechmeria coniospora TaxID=98403 RepID=A0A151GXX6_DRECN|nr:hypothetical protein DCS_03086 [Drechmeria coniospora]KYK61941.1 hypothetical protein DCS_03086 [Drechmeria coniospora]